MYEFLVERIIRVVIDKYKCRTIDFVDTFFTEFENIDEHKLGRNLVKEIRENKYYIP